MESFPIVMTLLGVLTVLLVLLFFLASISLLLERLYKLLEERLPKEPPKPKPSIFADIDKRTSKNPKR